MIGIHWDISWHESIGRDSFWTPAHLAIHLCGILAGFSAAYLILSTTFFPASPLRATSVRMWGFCGPLGAFIMAWGGLCMIASAPFDNWWHAAYGLDVKILSPPHAVLAIGIFGVILGVLMLLQGYMNRADGETRRHYLALFLYISGMMLIALTVFQMELTSRVSCTRCISIACSPSPSRWCCRASRAPPATNGPPPLRTPSTAFSCC